MTTWRDLLFPGHSLDFFARREIPAFDPCSSEYKQGNALLLAELSRLVYRHDVEEDRVPPSPPRTSFLAKAGLRQTRFFGSQQTDTQAMLVMPEKPPEYAVLVFRGTEQRAKDFLTDLRIGSKPVKSENIRVHAGFLQALDSVWKEIEVELSGIQCPLFYTGHSLGAALATVAAGRRTPQAVYTFGSPLVGNMAFVDSLKQIPIYRLVSGRDSVTIVPPKLLGFQHIGELQQLSRPRRRFTWNPAIWLRSILGPPLPLADHAPVNYVDRIGPVM